MRYEAQRAHLAVEDGLQAGRVEAGCAAVISKEVKGVHMAGRSGVIQCWAPEQQLARTIVAHIPQAPPAAYAQMLKHQ